MDVNTITTIISLISGIIGGNLAGLGMADKNLGALGNSIAGFFGGGLGQFILQLLGVLGGAATGAAATGAAAHGVDAAANLGGLDISSIIAAIGGGGVGGGALTAIIAFIKDALMKK